MKYVGLETLQNQEVWFILCCIQLHATNAVHRDELVNNLNHVAL